MIKLILILLILSFASSINCKTIIVAKNGSNSNIGNINYPYLTIQYAINMATENDTILIREGEYSESIILNKKKNINITTYNNENVIISPFLLTSSFSWEKHTEKIYKTKINEPIFQLFLNEQPIMQASFPNMKEEVFNSQNAADVFVLNDKTVNFPGISQFGNLKTGYFLGLCSDNIVSIGGNIVKSSGDQISLTDSAFYWKSDFENSYLGKGKGYLIGNLAFLDSPNEWFSDEDYLYVYPSNINDLEKIHIRKDIYCFRILNSENITISKLNLFGGSIKVTESSFCTLSNLTVKYTVPFHKPWSGFERFSQYWNGKEVITLGQETWTGKGVEIGGYKNKMNDCYIGHSWGDGATIYGIGNTVENCIIEDCDWIANDCAVLNISGSNHVVSNNTLKNSARSILLIRKLFNSKIIKNDISLGGSRCTDLGLIYNYDTDGKNTEIAYNFVHDSQSQNNGVGIYLDENNANHNIHHNIISNCSVGINVNKPCKNTSVYNNTLYKNEFSMGAWGNSGELSNVHTFNNLSNTNKKLSWNYDAFYGTKLDSNHIYFDNNIFIDPANHNFQLRKNSYPVDRGIKNEYTNVYKGSAPDMGALESGLPAWKYGSSLIIPNEKYYPPKAPLHLELVANTFDTTLFRWNYPFQLIDSFLVERKSATETSYSIIARLAVTDTLYNDANQPPGEYRYQVRAKNSYGISDPSNSIQIFNPITNNPLYFDAEESDLQEGTNAMGDLLINTDNKDWICFKGIELVNTTYDACMVNMAVPCEYAWQEIQVRLDKPMGRMIGKFRPPSTGGWDKFKMYSFPIEQIKGTHDVYFRFKGSYGVGTMDWFTFYDSNGEVKENIPYDSLCPFPSLKNREVKMRVFPNPVYKEINLTLDCQEKSTLEVEVFDTKGVVYYTNTFENVLPGTVEIPLHDDPKVNNLLPGVYMVKAHITSKKVDSFSMMKFIKTNE